MITILLFVYFASVSLSCYYMHLAFSKGGIYEDSNLDWDDLFYALLPGMNTFIAFFGFVFHFPIKPRNNKAINRLFKIKK